MENYEKRILALDTASRKTGYAIYIEGKIIESGTWILSTDKPLSDLEKRISGAISKHRITKILAEDIFKSDDPKKKSAYEVLGKCRGIVEYVSQKKDIPFTTLDPIRAKSQMWGYSPYKKIHQDLTRDQHKERMIRATEKLGYTLNENRNGKKDDDQADAIGLLIGYLRVFGLPIEHPNGSQG